MKFIRIITALVGILTCFQLSAQNLTKEIVEKALEDNYKIAIPGLCKDYPNSKYIIPEKKKIENIRFLIIFYQKLNYILKLLSFFYNLNF